jgi:hypothetical protein
MAVENCLIRVGFSEDRKVKWKSCVCFYVFDEEQKVFVPDRGEAGSPLAKLRRWFGIVP